MTDIPEHLVERAVQRLGGRIGAMALDSAPAIAWSPAPATPPAADQSPGQPPADGAVVDMAALMRAGLQIGDSRRSRLSEEYQVFAAEVTRSRSAQPQQPGASARGNLIMITSARPGEGKSFTALNLAASLALTRRTQTLLIDGDPKKDSVGARLGLKDRRGLFDLAALPGAPIGDLLVPTVIEGMSVLPVGTFAEDHGISLQIGAALARLARQYPDHLLILDAPPCLATSDASTLSPQVGQIIMVVEAERTQRHELEQALGMVAQCPNIVLMLNKMRPRVANAFGAYGYYGG